MQQSITILSSVNDLFEQRLDLLNTTRVGGCPFKIINVTTGYYINVRPLLSFTYLIDFPTDEGFYFFLTWCYANGF